MSQITPHFSWEEAQCRCGTCTMPAAVAIKVLAMAWLMEWIRKAIGGHEIIVDSWYRCPAHNAAVGGAPDSMHLQGLAVDFKIDGLTPDQVYVVLFPMWNDGFFGGIEKAPAHTHVDAGAHRSFTGPSK